MIPKRHHRTGFLSLETFASLLLVAVILAVFAYSLTQFSRMNDVLMSRQRAMLAAEGVLNEIRGGHRPTDAELAARFNGLTFDLQQRPGTGSWEGLTLVTVRVTGVAHGGVSVGARLDGYVKEASP